MSTTPIKNLASDVPSPVEESTLLTSAAIEHAPKANASTLSSTFKKDTTTKIEEIQKPAAKKTGTTQVSFWRRFASFLTGKPVEASDAIDGIQSKSKVDGIGVAGDKSNQPIDRIPTLDLPELPTKESKEVLEGKAPFELISQKDKINQKGLSIEKQVIALLKLRMKMSEEAANTAAANCEKYNKLKENAREFIQKIADDIEKDEKWARFFGRAQFVAGIAGAACAVIPLVAASSPAFAATWIATAFNPATGAAVSAASSSMFTGGKAIYTTNKNRRSAEKLAHDFDQEGFNELATAAATRMVEAMEAVNKFQGQLIDLKTTKHRVAQSVVRSS